VTELAHIPVRLPGPAQDLRERRFTEATGEGGRPRARHAPTDPRSPARHDRDRHYYARSLLRLAGVTQVLTPSDHGVPTHSRLMHTIKVAQVARSIADFLLVKRTDDHEALYRLGGLDVDVVETAALAHDLGHPPFGHIGEVILDRFARDELGLEDGYEGNAQTFRILTRLEPRSTAAVGLDVTSATLCAVLKYPRSRPRGETQGGPPKFGFYDSERLQFEFARVWLPVGYDSEAQSLEASIMDIADDITYALHDLEDFRGVGMLPLAEVVSEFKSWVQVYGARARRNEEKVGDERSAVGRLRLNLTKKSRYDAGLFYDAVRDAAEHLDALIPYSSFDWRVSAESGRTFISRMITQFIANVEVNPNPSAGDPPLELSAEHWHLIQVLKQVTRDFIIARTDVAAVQRGQQNLLYDLACALRDWSQDSEDRHRIPPELAAHLEVDGKRGLLDYVSSLTDGQAISLYATLKGLGPETVVPGLAF
jgi:dGTPase